MELEKEIQQSRFRSEYQKLFLNIIYTGNWLLYENARLLKPYGLTPQQYNVLRILRGQHPHPATVQLIARRMLDKNSNASRIVEKLRQKGLVERRLCSRDRRAVDVKITPRGLELLKELDGVLSVWEERLRTLSEEEARQMNCWLDKLRG